jgi:hypothetical protein
MYDLKRLAVLDFGDDLLLLMLRYARVYDGDLDSVERDAGHVGPTRHYCMRWRRYPNSV